jgi:predicted dehydrogenase
MQPLNLAFVGCGYATRKHSKTIASRQYNIKRYYASRDRGKAETFSSRLGGSGSFASYEDAFASPIVDAVLIATPPAQHLEQTLAALHAGKHVIVEKPPFLHAADFDKVRKAAHGTGRRVFVAENYFYKPLAYRIRELLQSGVIGEVLFLHINALKWQKADDWRNELSLAGGGALFEGGIHWVNFIANLGLTLESVTGFQPVAHGDLDKSMLAALEYEEGAVGALYYSWETPSLFKGLRLSKIYGRQGSITFESNGLFILLRGKRRRLIFPGFSDIAGYKRMFRDFFACILESKEPEFTFASAERDLHLIEEIYRTAKRNA